MTISLTRPNLMTKRSLRTTRGTQTKSYLKALMRSWPKLMALLIIKVKINLVGIKIALVIFTNTIKEKN